MTRPHIVRSFRFILPTRSKDTRGHPARAPFNRFIGCRPGCRATGLSLRANAVRRVHTAVRRVLPGRPLETRGPETCANDRGAPAGPRHAQICPFDDCHPAIYRGSSRDRREKTGSASLHSDNLLFSTMDRSRPSKHVLPTPASPSEPFIRVTSSPHGVPITAARSSYDQLSRARPTSWPLREHLAPAKACRLRLGIFCPRQRKDVHGRSLRPTGWRKTRSEPVCIPHFSRRHHSFSPHFDVQKRPRHAPTRRPLPMAALLQPLFSLALAGPRRRRCGIPPYVSHLRD